MPAHLPAAAAAAVAVGAKILEHCIVWKVIFYMEAAISALEAACDSQACTSGQAHGARPWATGSGLQSFEVIERQES